MDGNAIDLLKQFAGIDTAERGPYQCRACGADFDVQYHVCPECSGFSVEPDFE